jgi:hypothetical protein
LRLLSIRKTKHLYSQLYLLYYPHFTTTCFGLRRPSSGIAYTKCQEKLLQYSSTQHSSLPTAHITRIDHLKYQDILPHHTSNKVIL